MADFFDIGYYTETRSGKQRFVKLGYGAEMKQGGGFYLNFDPHYFSGQTVVMKRQRDVGQAQNAPQSSAPKPQADIDDDIPF